MKKIILTPLKNRKSESLELCRKYLGKTIRIEIDQAYGSTSPYGIVYELNYGYIPGTIAPDGDELDAYVIGTPKPVTEAIGKCIAIVHRLEDDDDKLILVSDEAQLTDEEIEKHVYFSEKYFKHTIIRT